MGNINCDCGFGRDTNELDVHDSVYSGFLEERSTYGTRSRFGVIREDNKLSIYADDYSTHPLLVIDMKKAINVSPHIVSSRTARKAFGFCVEIAEKKHLFYCGSHYMQEKWLEVLDSVKGKPTAVIKKSSNKSKVQSKDRVDWSAYLEHGEKLTRAHLKKRILLSPSSKPLTKAKSGLRLRDLSGLWVDGENEYILIESNGGCSTSEKSFDIVKESNKFTLSTGYVLDTEHSDTFSLIWRSGLEKMEWTLVRSVFTSEDKKFFEENGYIVLKNAVSKKQAQKASRELWRFLGASKSLKKSWQRIKTGPNGYVKFKHHQALWNNRQHPKIYKAFSELYNLKALWVNVGGMCLKEPLDEKERDLIPPEKRGSLHWDMDPWTRKAYRIELQGVLCLSDCYADSGGFQCVPGLNRTLRAWKADFERPTASRVEFYKEKTPIVLNPQMRQSLKHRIKAITAKAGDLIIWRNELPHGAAPNKSKRFREAQYITMYPATSQRSRSEYRQKLIARHQSFVVSPSSEPHRPGGIASSKPKSEQPKRRNSFTLLDQVASREQLDARKIDRRRRTSNPDIDVNVMGRARGGSDSIDLSFLDGRKPQSLRAGLTPSRKDSGRRVTPALAPGRNSKDQLKKKGIYLTYLGRKLVGDVWH